MKRTVLALLIFFLIFPPVIFSASVTSIQNAKTKDIDNSRPETGLYTIYSNYTTGESNPYPLKRKITCHTWQIEADKYGGIDWTIALKGSLDNSYYETFDSTTSVVPWQRHIVNYGYNWIKTDVFRTYTGTAPEITVKFQSGCN